MQLYTVLECKNCGHRKFVNDQWLLKNFPDLIGKPRHEIILSIRLKEKRYICNECGSKNIEISAVNEENIKKRKKDKNEKTSKWLSRINVLLSKKKWMYIKEVEIVESIQKQILNGKMISVRQITVLKNVEKNIKNRFLPRIVEGGSPGLGKRH